VGNAYTLSLGILGSGGITEGSTFQLSLYYPDAANNPVTVASTTATFTAATFPNNTHLLDYSASLPAVQAGDAWAGRPLGIALATTFGTGVGYWDVDHVRVDVVPEPGSLAMLAAGGLVLGFRFRRASRSKCR